MTVRSLSGVSNSTCFSALGGDEHEYLLAKLIQFLCPAPPVYYAGMLAVPNDTAMLKKTGIGRDTNRPSFDMKTIASELQRPVVRRLLALARFRNRHLAFGGTFLLGGEAPTNSASSGQRETRRSTRTST